MKYLTRFAAVALFALISTSAFSTDTRMVGVVFDRGADTAQIADEIKGDESVMYRFKAKKGQFLSVELRPKENNTEFILYAPGKWPGTEVHNSAAKSNFQYNGQIDRDGFHAVLVSRSSEEDDQGKSAKYDLLITLKNAGK